MLLLPALELTPPPLPLLVLPPWWRWWWRWWLVGEDALGSIISSHSVAIFMRLTASVR